MKSVITITAIVVSILLMGCEKENLSKNPMPQTLEATINENLQSNSKQTQGREGFSDSLTMVSELFFNGGISKLMIQDVDNYSIITALNILKITDKKVNLPNRLVNVNLMQHQIKLENGTFSIVGKEDTVLSIIENNPYITSPNFTGFLKDNPSIIENKNILCLLLYAVEMQIHEFSKSFLINPIDKYNEEVNDEGTCSFFETTYVARCGGGRGGYSTGQCWGFVKAAIKRDGFSLKSTEYTVSGINTIIHMHAFCCPI